MRTLNRIKIGLTCTASALSITGLIAYLFIGAWHLLIISIIAGVMGLTLKEEEESVDPGSGN